MIFANTKERILKYLDYKGISVKQFFIDTGIKRGFLDTDKLNVAVSDTHLAMICAAYEDASLEWFVSEKGDMIKKSISTDLILHEPESQYENTLYSELVKTKDTTIEFLRVQVADLMSDKNLLKLIIEKKLHEAS